MRVEMEKKAWEQKVERDRLREKEERRRMKFEENFGENLVTAIGEGGYLPEGMNFQGRTPTQEWQLPILSVENQDRDQSWPRRRDKWREGLRKEPNNNSPTKRKSKK